MYNPTTSRIPIPKLDLAKKKDKALHDTLVEKVTLMLELQKGDVNDTIKLQIQALDRQIDKLVYQMYGLSEDKIRVIEREEYMNNNISYAYIDECGTNSLNIEADHVDHYFYMLQF